jgi:hypothetical protein
VSIPDWIRLTLNLTAAALATYAALQARRNARAAHAHARRAQANARQAWGDVARTELATMKIRNLQNGWTLGDRSGPKSRA